MFALPPQPEFAPQVTARRAPPKVRLSGSHEREVPMKAILCTNSAARTTLNSRTSPTPRPVPATWSSR